ncbi:MAG: seg [Parcubacteria group bacterium]|nr:seg [Parcubacteria group bacterium]
MNIIGNKNAIRTQEFDKKKKREFHIKATAWTVLILIILALPIYLAREKHFLITNIEVSGNNVTKSEEVQKIIADDLAGNYLWIFPHSNAALYPKSKIKSDLLASIPRFSDVSVSLTDVHSLSVQVDEREPHSLYCSDISNPNAPARCYFLDASGFIFSEAPSFSGGVFNVYSSDPVLDPALRSTYLSPEKFAPLGNFIQALGEFGVYPKVFLSKGDEYHLILASGAHIMLKSDADLDAVRSNLESFLRNPKFDASTLDRFAYIDLRFGNKIFYKFKDEL